jgi:hypothetical protein
MADDGVDQHHAEDHAGVHPLAEQRAHQGGSVEDMDERRVELPQEAPQRPVCGLLREAVGAVERLAAQGFGAGEAGVGIAFEGGARFFNTDGVPGRGRRGHGHCGTNAPLFGSYTDSSPASMS